MADKDITIGIQATGADQAAAELKKPAEAVQATTAATKELTEAEADYQRRKAEYEARVAANREKGPQLPAEGANPFTDGSQLAAGQQAETVKETTKAIEEQVVALEDLTDAEAGVIDATKRVNQEAAKPDGFKALFNQQRLIEIGREFRSLSATVGDFAREFAKTERGQEAMAGLSEETKTFGKVAGSAIAAGAAGFAVGGPIGGVIAALNSLVKDVGGSFIDSQKKIEEANRSFAAEEERITKQSAERRREAANDAIEKQIQRENDKLEDQSEILREQQGLLRARKELADSEFELRQAQDEAGGKSRDQLEIERIQKELRDKENEVAAARSSRQDERNLIERERDARGIRAENARRRGEPEQARQFEEEQAKADEALRDRERADAVKAQEEEAGLNAARNRAAAGLTRIAAGANRDAQGDTARRAREREAEAARARSGQAAAAGRREGFGREGEGIADSVGLENIGNRIAADPTGGGLDELTAAIERALTTADDARARKLRQAIERIERLEAKIKKDGDTGR